MPAAAVISRAARLDRPEGVIGQCDPVDGPGLRWTAEVRRETRQRVKAVCRSRGATRDVCALLDAWVVRESSGRPGVWHDQKRGLGALGLMLSAHYDKWPGTDEHPAWCQPEASALVAMAIMRRALLRWPADDLAEIDAVFGGRFRTITTDEGAELRVLTRTDHSGICWRLKKRGVRCRARVGLADIGRRTKNADRPTLAMVLATRFTSRQDALAVKSTDR